MSTNIDAVAWRHVRLQYMYSLVRLFLVVTFFAAALPVFAAPIVAGSFSTTWQTNTSGYSANNEISFFLDNGPGSVCSGVIYWEEVGNDTNNGTSSLDSNCAETVVTFPTPGTYRVDISGTFPAFRMMDRFAERDADKLLSVNQWGDNIWQTTTNMFWGASNFVLTATDVPNLSLVTDMSSMFYDAESFNSNINNWDVSNVTNMRYLFGEATAFNQPLNNWNTSNVTDMSNMFVSTFGVGSFNQPLAAWDVSSVIDMSYMFTGAVTFNQPLEAWDTAAVTTMQGMFYNSTAFNQPLAAWNVSNVTDMSLMFFFTRDFNQPLQSWNVSNVTTFNAMFNDAAGFNQPLATWDIGSATDVEDMFGDSAIDTFNYSSTLIGWSALSGVPASLVLGNVPTTYCDTADTARTRLISDLGWTIADLGLIVCQVPIVETAAQESTKVGIRRERLEALATAVSSTSEVVSPATKESFITSVRRLLGYLTKHENDLANLSQTESTELIILLRDVLRQILSWLPGV